MRPMLGREVVKGKQDFFIFLQAFAGFREFSLVRQNPYPIQGSTSVGARADHAQDLAPAGLARGLESRNCKDLLDVLLSEFGLHGWKGS